MSSFKEISLKWYKYLLGIVAIAYNPQNLESWGSQDYSDAQEKKKNENLQFTSQAYNPRSREAEAGGSLWVWGQSNLRSEF